MSAPSDKAISLPKWDGEDKNFHNWWMRFKAYAKVYKFKESIGTDPEAMMPAKDSDALDPTKDRDLLSIEAKRTNETAIACLTMAFTSEEQLGYVHEAMTENNPDGLAFLVI